MITYNDIVKWFKEQSTIYCTVNTSDEFDEIKNDILKFLMNYSGAGVEATFTMYKIEMKKERDNGRLIVEKNMPQEKSDTIRSRRLTRAECGILDDYREHDANEINNIIVPLLEVPPLTEERITELINAVNNARTHSHLF